MKVESYRAQTDLTQFCNCQKFGHVWANCKQPPRCLWCGGGYPHREYPEKTNAGSTPSCCNCTLVGEKPHRASYRGCSHSKRKLKRRRAQRNPMGPSGRGFFRKLNSPEQSYAAALRKDNKHQQPQVPQTDEKSVRQPVHQRLPQEEIQNTYLSVRAYNSPYNYIVAAVVHEIIT
jgi:hypothetical protein